MKNIILFLFCFGYTLHCFCQYKVTDGIYVYKGNLGGVQIHVKAESENKFTNITMKQKKAEKIQALLLKIRTKFYEWQQIAARDSVVFVDKEFKSDFNFLAGVSWSNGGEWWSNSLVTFVPYFRVENGKSWLSFRLSQTISASDNRFIRLRDFSWNFYSVEEIDAFIEATQKENIQKALLQGVSDSAKFR